MKIIEIVPSLNDGGAERFVVDLSNQLSLNKDIDITVISLFKPTSSKILNSELNSRIKLVQFDKKKGFDISNTLKLYKFLKREKPDIIHTHLKAFDSIILYVLLRRTLIFHTIHSDPVYECPNRFRRILRKYFFNYKNIFPVTISDESTDSFKLNYSGIPFYKIYNGRSKLTPSNNFDTVQKEIDALKKSNSTKVFINVARITKVKNQRLLIKVFNDLSEEGFDIILLIIGSKRDKNLFKVLDSIAGDSVHIMGPKENPFDYLLLSDAFCLTSLFEGMPISLIEAFQAGCVPICTPTGGINSMIESDYNGILSKQLSEASFKEAVLNFLSKSEDEITLMSENGVKTYHAKYSIETTANQYLDLINNSLKIR